VAQNRGILWPMTKMQFIAAAERVKAEDAEEAEEGEAPPDPVILEWTMAGQEFKANKPTTTQVILLSATAAEDGTLRSLIASSLTFLDGIMLEDGYKRLRKLIAKGIVSHDLLIGGDDANESGLVDWIVSQVSDGRPTQSSTDSSPSPKKGGGKLTGRAPGKGSIQSGSPSGDS